MFYVVSLSVHVVCIPTSVRPIPTANNFGPRSQLRGGSTNNCKLGTISYVAVCAGSHGQDNTAAVDYRFSLYLINTPSRVACLFYFAMSEDSSAVPSGRMRLVDFKVSWLVQGGRKISKTVRLGFDFQSTTVVQALLKAVQKIHELSDMSDVEKLEKRVAFVHCNGCDLKSVLHYNLAENDCETTPLTKVPIVLSVTDGGAVQPKAMPKRTINAALLEDSNKLDFLPCAPRSLPFLSKEPYGIVDVPDEVNDSSSDSDSNSDSGSSDSKESPSKPAENVQTELCNLIKNLFLKLGIGYEDKGDEEVLLSFVTLTKDTLCFVSKQWPKLLKKEFPEIASPDMQCNALLELIKLCRTRPTCS